MAKAHYCQCLELEPNNQVVMDNMKLLGSQLYELKNHWVKNSQNPTKKKQNLAKAHYRQCLELEPNNHVVMDNMKLLGSQPYELKNHWGKNSQKMLKNHQIWPRHIIISVLNLNPITKWSWTYKITWKPTLWAQEPSSLSY